jgi:hypothetical protein
VAEKGFNPYKILTINKFGAYQWSNTKSPLKKYLIEYFKIRNEDNNSKKS